MDFEIEEKEIGEGHVDSNYGGSVSDFFKDLVGVVRALVVDGGVEQADEAAGVSVAAFGARSAAAHWFHVHLQERFRLGLVGAASGFADTGGCSLRIGVDGWRVVVRGVGAYRAWCELERHGHHQIGARSGAARAIPVDTASDLYRHINVHGGNRFAAR